LIIPVNRRGNAIRTELPGPPNQTGRRPSEFSLPLRIEILPSHDRVLLLIGRQKISLALHQDSGWVRIQFPCGLLTRVRAICRFRLESLQPHFGLYVSPVHLDPESPAMPISHPRYYSIYLAKLHDTFATLGLAEDTWALNEGRINEAAFLEQAYVIHEERSRMFLDAVRRMPRGLTVCVFDAPDRIQHMFYRHDHSEHPANQGRDVTRYVDILDEMYQRMDKLVGEVAAEIDERQVLMVISDHGFCTFQRGVNLNAWLIENGYLTMHPEGKSGEYLAGVDVAVHFPVETGVLEICGV
jgi:hypothetical protein